MDTNLINALREMMKEELSPINKRLESVETELKGKLESVETELKGIKEEHGLLLRGIEEKLQIQSKSVEKIEFIEGDIKVIRRDMDKIKKDFAVVEQVTAKNWSEINELKTFK